MTAEPSTAVPDEASLTDAVELLLDATFTKQQPGGGSAKFLYGRPGAANWGMEMGAEIYFSNVGLLKAALKVRAAGPTYLRSFTIADVKSQLTSFLQQNFYLLSSIAWGPDFDDSYAYHVSLGVKAQLSRALALSTIFSPRIYTTAFPLVPVRVVQDFVSDPFFLVKPEALSSSHFGCEVDLKPRQFPPFASWEHRIEIPSAWLGVRSPAKTSAVRTRNAVLGAVALLPHPRERYMFSGRKMFGGAAWVRDGTATLSSSEPCTPAMMHDIKIEAADQGWLELLAGKLVDRDEQAVRHVRALEYYHRAWPLDEPERFPVLFMALDAMFSNASQHTQAVADAVGQTMGPSYDVARLKLLLGMRAAVIHGGAPNVYDSQKYVKYYETYSQNPVFDLELITASCLQHIVFEGQLVSKPHTYAKQIKDRLGIDP
jgi:hypothetical protein